MGARREVGEMLGINQDTLQHWVRREYGPTVNGWKAALGELAIIYPDRINNHL